MKKTFKLLTVTLVLTMSSQSFAMSRIFSRVSKVGTRLAAQAGTQLTSAATKLSKSATLARLMPSNKLVAKRMLYASGTGVALATAAHADNAKEAQKELTPEQMKEKLDELARTEEWTPEQMQAKLNELKAVEEASSEAAKEEAFARTQPYPVMELNFEGVYTARTLEDLGRLQFMKNHATLFAKCLARETTDRTQFPESDKKQENECADLWKKAYGLMGKQAAPEYDERHFTFERLLRNMVMNNEDVFAKTSELSLPIPESKMETTLDIRSDNTVDLTKFATEGHQAQFKFGTKIIMPHRALYETLPFLNDERMRFKGTKYTFAQTPFTIESATPISYGNATVNKIEGNISIVDPSKVEHVCIHGQSKAPCQECSK